MGVVYAEPSTNEFLKTIPEIPEGNTTWLARIFDQLGAEQSESEYDFFNVNKLRNPNVMVTQTEGGIERIETVARYNAEEEALRRTEEMIDTTPPPLPRCIKQIEFRETENGFAFAGNRLSCEVDDNSLNIIYRGKKYTEFVEYNSSFPSCWHQNVGKYDFIFATYKTSITGTTSCDNFVFLNVYLFFEENEKNSLSWAFNCMLKRWPIGQEEPAQYEYRIFMSKCEEEIEIVKTTWQDLGYDNIQLRYFFDPVQRCFLAQ